MLKRERGEDCLFSISDTRGMQNTTIEIKGASFFCRKVLLLEIFTTLKDNHCSYGKKVYQADFLNRCNLCIFYLIFNFNAFSSFAKQFFHCHIEQKELE